MSIFLAFLFIYFLLYVLYNLIFSVAGLIPYRKDRNGRDSIAARFCILIPAYKEDEVILSTVQHALNQNYSDLDYEVYVIADSFEKSTLEELEKTKAKVIKVEFEKSTKSKSINWALEIVPSDFDLVVILDADNIINFSFLRDVNKYYQNGFYAMQAKRVAKNLNTKVAVLDAVSEAINNHIFRKGPEKLGLSSAIIGSGMIFKFELFKSAMKSIHAVGGFDKELQIEFARIKNKIHYLEDVLVFDEKVETVQHFKNQRKRWMSVQFIYLRKYFYKAFLYLLKGNIDYFNYALLSNIFLPKFISIFIMIFTALIMSSINISDGLPWFILIILFVLAQFLAIPRKLYPLFLKSIFYIPVLFYFSIQSLLNIKNANKSFINTKHNKSEIDNNVFQE